MWRFLFFCHIEAISRAALALALGLLILSGCTVYQTAPGVYAPAPPSAFDRAWEAARGAAYDEGVTVTSEDRSRGVDRGPEGRFRRDPEPHHPGRWQRAGEHQDARS